MILIFSSIYDNQMQMLKTQCQFQRMNLSLHMIWWTAYLWRSAKKTTKCVDSSPYIRKLNQRLTLSRWRMLRVWFLRGYHGRSKVHRIRRHTDINVCEVHWSIHTAYTAICFYQQLVCTVTALCQPSRWRWSNLLSTSSNASSWLFCMTKRPDSK